jgi:hypothetical protein
MILIAMEPTMSKLTIEQQAVIDNAYKYDMPQKYIDELIAGWTKVNDIKESFEKYNLSCPELTAYTTTAAHSLLAHLLYDTPEFSNGFIDFVVPRYKNYYKEHLASCEKCKDLVSHKK